MVEAKSPLLYAYGAPLRPHPLRAGGSRVHFTRISIFLMVPSVLLVGYRGRHGAAAYTATCLPLPILPNVMIHFLLVAIHRQEQPS